jgi:hypothetical protein
VIDEEGTPPCNNAGRNRDNHTSRTNSEKETKMKNKKLLVIGLLLISLALLPVTSALALEPTIETFHDEGTQSLDCGSFVASGSYQQDGQVTTFYDAAGNPIRDSVFIRFSGTLTNPLNGKTLTDTDSFTVAFDLQEGTVTGLGLTFHMKIPGGGVAVLDAGKIFVDEEGNVTLAGRRDVKYEGVEVICAALS